jgi:hypothetical protein
VALTSLPATGNPITRYNSYPVLKQVLIPGPNATLTFNDATKSIIVDAAASGTAGTTAVWGGITGTLADQLDLQSALNAKVNASALAAVATSGLYTDLSGRPVLATVATTGAYSDLTGKPSLATVATSGLYSDLTGRPSLATVATTGAYSDLTGRPTLAAIATSGSASDLSTGTVPAGRLPIFGTALVGAVPASGGGTANFLRADGTWTAPPTGTSSPDTLLDQSAQPVSHTGDTAEFTLATITIPAGGLGANGKFILEGDITLPSGTNARTVRIKVGGTTIATIASTAASSAYFEVHLSNRGSTSSQRYMEWHLLSNQTVAKNQGPLTLDSTAAIAVTITAQLGVSTDTITLESRHARLYSKA